MVDARGLLMEAPCPFCEQTVDWSPEWREWRGHCSKCGRHMYAPDPRLSSQPHRVCLLPPKSEWARVEVGV